MIRKRFQEIFRRIIFNRKMRLSNRAVVLFTFSVLLPIILILYIYSQHLLHIVGQEISNNMQLSAGQLKSNVDYRFEQINESALSMVSTGYPYVSSESGDMAEQLKEFGQLKLLIGAYEGKHMISKVRFYVPSDKIYAKQRDNFFPLSDFAKSQYGDANHAIERGAVWIETHSAIINDSIVPTNVISYCMAISSRTDYEKISSVLQLDVEESKLSEIFAAGINTHEEIYLVNSNGVIIAHPDPKLIGKKGLSESELNTVLGQKTGSIIGSTVKNVDFIAFSKLDAVGWYLVIRIPASVAYGTSIFSVESSQVILIFAVLTVFTIAFILLYTSVIENTVKRINKAVKELNSDGVEKVGSLFAQDAESKDPLTVFENNANRLVVTIKDLLEESYEAELKARDYHLKALQAQINPHFLYNTLDAIKWMVLGGDKDGSVWMINAFSKYFRLSLSKGRDIVTLGEELDLIRAYVGIIEKRYKGVFTMGFDVDDGLLKYLIPKLTLQPLVENALQHGVLHSENDGGQLVITANQDGNRLVITVEDNGNGMSEEQVTAINSMNSNTESYGIPNVNERLKLFGGDGLAIASQLKKGTVVTMSIPLKLE